MINTYFKGDFSLSCMNINIQSIYLLQILTKRTSKIIRPHKTGGLFKAQIKGFRIATNTNHKSV